jgi:hypothetical protein
MSIAPAAKNQGFSAKTGKYGKVPSEIGRKWRKFMGFERAGYSVPSEMHTVYLGFQHFLS